MCANTLEGLTEVLCKRPLEPKGASASEIKLTLGRPLAAPGKRWTENSTPPRGSCALSSAGSLRSLQGSLGPVFTDGSSALDERKSWPTALSLQTAPQPWTNVNPGPRAGSRWVLPLLRQPRAGLRTPENFSPSPCRGDPVSAPGHCAQLSGTAVPTFVVHPELCELWGLLSVARSQHPYSWHRELLLGSAACDSDGHKQALRGQGPRPGHTLRGVELDFLSLEPGGRAQQPLTVFSK